MDFEKPHTLMILASKGQGKSTLISQFLTNESLYMGKYSKVFVFSPTFRSDPAFTDLYIPDSQIFPSVEDEYLQEMIDLKMSTDYSLENFLIIFDDCISDKNIKGSRLLKQLLLNSRHYGDIDDEGVQAGFSLIFSTQHLKSIPTYIRQNMNWVIAFKINNNDALRTLHSEYGASYSYNDFLKIMRVATSEKYSFLMTDGVTYYKKFTPMRISL
jgi:hypothetical protein